MIYTYKHLSHSIEGFHTEIVYFFEQLFKHTNQNYDEKVLLRSGFIKLVNQSPKLLKANLMAITKSYYLLSSNDKNVVISAFYANCQIKKLCSDIKLEAVKFEEISDEDFRKLLKDFLTMLWEDYPQNKLVERKFGTVLTHFNDFLNSAHQKALVCPFCGLNKLKPSGSINRNAYDHFVPKAMYPFVSVNFQNLFPICHECNSDEKKDIDTLYLKDKRRKLLFPFDTRYNRKNLTVTVVPKEVFNPKTLKTLLTDIDWEFAIKLAGKSDVRLSGWDDLFKIKRRYTEHIKRYQTEWFGQLQTRFIREVSKGTTFKSFKKEILEDAAYIIEDTPLGILKFVYFKFLFSVPSFESKLKAISYS